MKENSLSRKDAPYKEKQKNNCCKKQNHTYKTITFFIFSVRSFYEVFTTQTSNHFPWKNIWRSKAPPKAALFVWTASSLGKILTINNLRKLGLILIGQCCLCRNSSKIVDNLLLHCEFARVLWNYFSAKWDQHGLCRQGG